MESEVNMPYLEAIEDDARTNYQFDMTGGTAKGFYYTSGSFLTNLQNVVYEVLGYTNTFAKTGQASLRRLLPKTHPRFPYLYAHRISSIIGKGSGSAVKTPAIEPLNRDIGANPIADYFHYQLYEIGVEFGSRPYPLIADSAFENTRTGSWVPKNGGQRENFTYAPEWARFCDYDYTIQDNTIQGQQGSFSLVDGGKGEGQLVPFMSPPWMWLPDQLLKVKWYQVPYRFITSSNSYIAGGPNRNWRGRVNQNAWWNWPAGSLLYMGYSVHKYTPPSMGIGTYPSYTSVGTAAQTVLGNLLHYERLCDIELTFLYTNRYMSGSLGTQIENGNYINKGHNLLPNVTNGKFYYATRTPPNGNANVQNPPAWYSFPVEVLFTDPDAGGGPSTDNDN